MTHLDEELLAEWALDQAEPEPAAAEHLSTCAHCQAVLEELRVLTGELHATPELATPPAHVWSRIATELDLAAPTVQEVQAPSAGPGERGTAAPGEPTPARRRTYGRGMLTLAAGVAVVLGIGIGLGAASVLGEDEPLPTPPVAAVQLEPLPGKSGGGTADLIQAGDELQVAVSGLAAPDGYYEVWLINEDGERMVSLGVLDPAQGGTFRIPENLTSEGYRIVDVSLEPNDGNPAHSRDSIVRGTLPS